MILNLDFKVKYYSTSNNSIVQDIELYL